jgi:hypothetical protein
MSRLSRSRSCWLLSGQPDDCLGPEVAQANHPFGVRMIDGSVESLAPGGRLFGFTVAVDKVASVKFGPDRLYVDRAHNGPISMDALLGSVVDQRRDAIEAAEGKVVQLSPATDQATAGRASFAGHFQQNVPKAHISSGPDTTSSAPGCKAENPFPRFGRGPDRLPAKAVLPEAC